MLVIPVSLKVNANIPDAGFVTPSNNIPSLGSVVKFVHPGNVPVKRGLSVFATPLFNVGNICPKEPDIPTTIGT